MPKHTNWQRKTVLATLPAILLLTLSFGVAYAANQTTLTGGTCSGQGQSLAASYPLAAFGATNANDEDCGSYMLGSVGTDTSMTFRICQGSKWYYDAPSGKVCIFPWDMDSVTSNHNVCMEFIPYTCSGNKLTSDS